jgi:hypothetical protein
LAFPDTGLRASRAPIHLTTMNRVGEMTEEITDIGVNFQQVRRAIVQKVEALGKKLPADISEHLVRNHGYGQSVPDTEVRLTQLISILEQRLVGFLQSYIERMLHININNSATVNTNSSVPATEDPLLYPEEQKILYSILVFIWASKWHPVPENFQFPRCTVKTMWDLWHFVGDIPVRNVERESLKQLQNSEI